MRARNLGPVGIVVLMVVTACGSGSAAEPQRSTAAHPSVAAGGVRLLPVATVASPTAIAAPPKDRRHVFVTEQEGVIRTIRAGRLQAKPFLDLRAKVRSGGEQGLLGLAFAPDYAKSGRLYVYYTAKDSREVLEEYRRGASSETANADSGRKLFVHQDPEGNHNGGQLQFGPDGLLYIGTGDGGGAGDNHGTRGNAQDLSSPLGKLLRIDPRQSGGKPFTVPQDNPFIGRDGVLPEIYAFGLRNPWRFSFDRVSGALTLADVGQDAFEEINYLPKGAARGANFGWRVYEGRSRFAAGSAPGAVPPVITFKHEDGYCSITGGYVVRDRALTALYGRYVFADYCKPGVRSVRLRAKKASGLQLVSGASAVRAISTFGEDAQGRVYVASLNGPVYRLTAR